MISPKNNRMPDVYMGTPGEVQTALERCGAGAVILLMFPHMEISNAHKIWLMPD